MYKSDIVKKKEREKEKRGSVVVNIYGFDIKMTT